MKNVLEIVWLIPLLPFLGFLINGLARKILSKTLVSIIGCGVVLASFALSIWVFLQVKSGNTHTANYFDFISVQSLHIPFAFQIDQLSIISKIGNANFSDVFSDTARFTPGEITTITLLLFVGATGKSAQIPLYTWLPDAMAGPTPVSALIHAATMVTAGVYMVARSNALYSLSELSQNVVAIVGLATAILAATIALKQNDIKKVLAYSTISQLGYMFLGLGVGAYTGAVFHVMTHAFFKALLFLGAGSVIHAMHHEQDIRNMGGLHKKLPVTHITFLIGCIAIAGIPPFSGF